MNRLLLFLVFLTTICSCEKDKTDYTETDRQIIQDYIASNNLTAQSTSSGLYYVIEKPGSDSHPTASSTVIINYTGYLTGGSIFDKSVTGTPMNISLTSVIKGWQEGVPLFGRGGKGKLLIPSALGYGSTGSYGIPPNTVLIFDIELVDFY
jgi:FKBP-type peptidyl-prolyl cis-trans isomerase FkpA